MTETLKTSEPLESPPRSASGVMGGVGRGIALFFGVMFLVNLLAQFRLAEYKYDPNHWWISFSPLPKIVEQFASFCAALLFIAYAIVPPMSAWRRRGTRMAVELLWVLIAWNVINYYGGIARGAFHAGFPVPFQLYIAAAFAAIWVNAGHEQPARGAIPWVVMVLTICIAAVVFPLLQIVSFGSVDHRRAAQVHSSQTGVAILFNNGDARSPALANSVTTAADLYRGRLIGRVFIASATPAQKDAAVEAVRALATAAGIAADDIDTKPSGLGIDATVLGAMAAYPKDEAQLLPISEYPQLPRIDMLFAQEGRTTYPVPVSTHSGVSLGTLLREVPLLWKCYFAALTR